MNATPPLHQVLSNLFQSCPPNSERFDVEVYEKVLNKFIEMNEISECSWSNEDNFQSLQTYLVTLLRCYKSTTREISLRCLYISLKNTIVQNIEKEKKITFIQNFFDYIYQLCLNEDKVNVRIACSDVLFNLLELLSPILTDKTNSTFIKTIVCLLSLYQDDFEEVREHVRKYVNSSYFSLEVLSQVFNFSLKQLLSSDEAYLYFKQKEQETKLLLNTIASTVELTNGNIVAVENILDFLSNMSVVKPKILPELSKVFQIINQYNTNIIFESFFNLWVKDILKKKENNHLIDLSELELKILSAFTIFFDNIVESQHFSWEKEESKLLFNLLEPPEDNSEFYQVKEKLQNNEVEEKNQSIKNFKEKFVVPILTIVEKLLSATNSKDLSFLNDIIIITLIYDSTHMFSDDNNIKDRCKRVKETISVLINNNTEKTDVSWPIIICDKLSLVLDYISPIFKKVKNVKYSEPVFKDNYWMKNVFIETFIQIPLTKLPSKTLTASFPIILTIGNDFQTDNKKLSMKAIQHISEQVGRREEVQNYSQAFFQVLHSSMTFREEEQMKVILPTVLSFLKNVIQPENVKKENNVTTYKKVKEYEIILDDLLTSAVYAKSVNQKKLIIQTLQTLVEIMGIQYIIYMKRIMQFIINDEYFDINLDLTYTILNCLNTLITIGWPRFYHTNSPHLKLILEAIFRNVSLLEDQKEHLTSLLRLIEVCSPSLVNEFINEKTLQNEESNKPLIEDVIEDEEEIEGYSTPLSFQQRLELFKHVSL
ncbi:hypothetical protein ABK040_015610 [Willaertia magna]